MVQVHSFATQSHQVIWLVQCLPDFFANRHSILVPQSITEKNSALKKSFKVMMGANCPHTPPLRCLPPPQRAPRGGLNFC